jgi:glycosyltransferase involved in cell wall biosynthesis
VLSGGGLAIGADRGVGRVGHGPFILGQDAAVIPETDMPPPGWDPSHSEPLRVMVLRGVDGAGGGADKIILRNAAQLPSDQVRMTLCFMRHRQDADYDFDRRCAALDLDYREVLHRGATDRTVLPRLREMVQRIRPQIIHSHDYKANFLATRLAHGTGIRRISTAHGWTGSGWRERAIYYPGDRLILRRFPGVIAVSDPIRDQLIRWGAKPGRVRVLLNGIDPQAYRRDDAQRQRARQQLGYTVDDVVVGAVGRVERQKRFDLLVKSLAMLAPQQPRIRLAIAGDGSLTGQLRQQVAQLGLTGRVQLLGHCSNMREIYPAFDLLVQSSDYEGTPTVVVEAMAMQIPVVATDVGGTRQLMTHQEHGLLVPPGRPDLLCQAIRRTLDDEAATRLRTLAARHRVETSLSYQQRLQKLLKAYCELAIYGSLDAAP